MLPAIGDADARHDLAPTEGGIFRRFFDGLIVRDATPYRRKGDTLIRRPFGNTAPVGDAQETFSVNINTDKCNYFYRYIL